MRCVGCGVQAQQRSSSDKCLIVIMPSGSGSGPPKPPLTRHRVSSSERAGRCDAGNARANARRAGRQGWRESVLSIHDPWCYTLSCNTCNLSRHPLSRAVCGAVRCGAVRCGAWGGNCSDPQPSDEHESLTRACHVYCLGKIDCSSRQLGARAGEVGKGWGQHSAMARGVPLEPPLATHRRVSSPLSRRLQYRRVGLRGCCVFRADVPERMS